MAEEEQDDSLLVAAQTNSARVGALLWAPMRVTETAPALVAKAQATGKFFPSLNATASAALKTSPAAVESMAFTLGDGIN